MLIATGVGVGPTGALVGAGVRLGVGEGVEGALGGGSPGSEVGAGLVAAEHPRIATMASGARASVARCHPLPKWESLMMPPTCLGLVYHPMAS